MAKRAQDLNNLVTSVGTSLSQESWWLLCKLSCPQILIYGGFQPVFIMALVVTHFTTLTT